MRGGPETTTARSFRRAAHNLGMTNFDQSQHPRNAAGTSKGGQFAEKQNSAPESGLSEPTAVSADEANDRWLALSDETAKLQQALNAARLRQTQAGLVNFAHNIKAAAPDAKTVELAIDEAYMPEDQKWFKFWAIRNAAGREVHSVEIFDDGDVYPAGEDRYPVLTQDDIRANLGVDRKLLAQVLPEAQRQSGERVYILDLDEIITRDLPA